MNIFFHNNLRFMDNNYDTMTDVSLDSNNNNENNLDKSFHYYDFNSIKRISNPREYKLQQKRKLDKFISICLKSIIIFIILLFNLPICISELYYGFTDNSCVHIKYDKLLISLYIYLIVDGIFGIFITLLISIYLCYFIDFEKMELNGLKKIIINILSFIGLLFNLSWTVIGSIIFWGIIDNYSCKNNIYCFIFAELIIKIIFLFLQIVKLTNQN